MFLTKREHKSCKISPRARTFYNFLYIQSPAFSGFYGWTGWKTAIAGGIKMHYGVWVSYFFVLQRWLKKRGLRNIVHCHETTCLKAQEEVVPWRIENKLCDRHLVTKSVWNAFVVIPYAVLLLNYRSPSYICCWFLCPICFGIHFSPKSHFTLETSDRDFCQDAKHGTAPNGVLVDNEATCRDSRVSKMRYAGSSSV